MRKKYNNSRGKKIATCVVVVVLTCCSDSSHSRKQPQDVCTCEGFFHQWCEWCCLFKCRQKKKDVWDSHREDKKKKTRHRQQETHQNPSPLHVAILLESLWLQDMQNIPFLPCCRGQQRVCQCSYHCKFS